LSRFFLKVSHENTITVKGYAEKKVKSDIGSFGVNITVRAKKLPDAYQELGRAERLLLGNLKNSGFRKDEIFEKNISFDKTFIYEKGKKTDNVKQYVLSKYFMIKTKRLELISKSFKKCYNLLNNNIELRVDSPDYLISDPGACKIELLKNASANAKMRAESIARSVNSRLGALVSSKQGVFQITAPCSTDVSSWGTYDTNTIDKVMKIVVTSSFKID
jgi:hypothetical protein